MLVKIIPQEMLAKGPRLFACLMSMGSLASMLRVRQRLEAPLAWCEAAAAPPNSPNTERQAAFRQLLVDPAVVSVSQSRWAGMRTGYHVRR